MLCILVVIFIFFTDCSTSTAATHLYSLYYSESVRSFYLKPAICTLFTSPTYHFSVFDVIAFFCHLYSCEENLVINCHSLRLYWEKEREKIKRTPATYKYNRQYVCWRISRPHIESVLFRFVILNLFNVSSFPWKNLNVLQLIISLGDRFPTNHFLALLIGRGLGVFTPCCILTMENINWSDRRESAMGETKSYEWIYYGQ